MYLPEQTLRTEWKVLDNKKLFSCLRNGIPIFNSYELSGLETSFNNNNIEYFEAAWYLEKLNVVEDDDIPPATFVLKGRRLFLDINFPQHKLKLINTFSSLAKNSVEFVKERKISKNELFERVKALAQTSLEEQLESVDDLDSEEIVDDDGVLNRSAFLVLAKQPALDWVKKCEESYPAGVPKIDWSLEKINNEPLTVLGPMGIELFEDKDKEYAFSKLKLDAFVEFLYSFTTDDMLWPEPLNDKNFDKWFDLKRLGIVLDSESINIWDGN